MDEADDRLRAAFAAPDPPREGQPPGMSAVLVPLVRVGGGHVVLFTRRSTSLSQHPGEISFPGGRVERSDRTPLAAALREFHEEVGVPPEAVRPFGHVTDYLTYRGVLVSAYAGVVSDSERSSVLSGEVDEVLLVPLGDLLIPGPSVPPPASPLGRRYGCHRYEGRELPGSPRGDRVVHYFHLVPVDGEGPPPGGRTVVWGITGELVARFLGRLGWKPPEPPRAIRTPREFLP